MQLFFSLGGIGFCFFDPEMMMKRVSPPQYHGDLGPVSARLEKDATNHSDSDLATKDDLCLSSAGSSVTH